MLSTYELIEFEQDIAEAFNRGEIRAPVHLSGGNEQFLIDYFDKNFAPGDWVCTTWRSHYHALLAGVPAAEVRRQIMEGRSITLTFPEYRVVSSAIVGGVIPIALGIALGIKRGERGGLVHCFVGDMTAMTGAYAEAVRYSSGQDLPVSWVVEDNGKSVLTNTYEAWGMVRTLRMEHRCYYDMRFPHAGAGRRVEF